MLWDPIYDIDVKRHITLGSCNLPRPTGSICGCGIPSFFVNAIFGCSTNLVNHICCAALRCWLHAPTSQQTAEAPSLEDNQRTVPYELLSQMLHSAALESPKEDVIDCVIRHCHVFKPLWFQDTRNKGTCVPSTWETCYLKVVENFQLEFDWQLKVGVSHKDGHCMLTVVVEPDRLKMRIEDILKQLKTGSALYE